jgi:autotransporter translocation and assembly factor TamB
MKKFLKIAAAGAIVMIGLLSAGYGLLQTDRVKRFVQNEIESIAKDRLNARLTVGSLSGNLLWNATLNHVTVEDEEGMVLSAGQISVDYVLLSLLKGTILIPRIKIVNPELNLRSHPEKTFNILAIPKASEPPSAVSEKKQGFQVLVRSVIIQNGLIRIQRGSGYSGPSLDVRMDMKAAFKGGAISIEDLKMATPKSSLAIRGRARLSPAEDQLDLAIKLPGLWLPEISPFLPVNLPERELKGEFAVKGTLNKVEVTFQLIPEKDQSLQGKARLELKDPVHLEVECAMKALQLQPWLPSLPATVSGAIKVALTGDQLKEMNGQALIEVVSSSFFGQEIEKGCVSISVRPGLDTILEASLIGPSGDLAVSAAGGVRGIVSPEEPLEGEVHVRSAKADLSSLDIGPLRTQKVAAAVKVYKEPGSPIEKTHMDLDLSFGTTRWWKVNINAGSIVGDFEYGRFSIGKAEFQLPGARLNLLGTGDVHGSVAADINLGFQDLHHLAVQLLNKSLSGTAEVSLHVSGKTARPCVQGTITGAALSGFGADLDSFRLELLGDTATFGGRASFSGKELKREGMKISSLNISGTVAPEKAAFRVRAEMDHESLVALNGSLSNLDRTSKLLAIHQLQVTVKGRAWGNSEPIAAILNPDSVEVKAFGLVRDSQRFSAAGNFSYEGRGDLTISLNNMRLNEIMAVAGINGPIEGVFNSRLRLTGSTAAPIIALDADFTKVKWDSYELSSGTLRLHYAKQSASVKAAVHSPSGDTLNISGVIPVDLSLEASEGRIRDHGLDLAVEGKAINLGIAPRFLPFLREVKARGHIKATVKGNPFDPVVDGSITVDGEKALLRNVPDPITRLRAEAALSNREIKLKGLSFAFGAKGRVEAYGVIGLKGFGLHPEGMNLHVDGNAISLALLPRFIPALREIQARVDLEASVKGDPFDPEVKGSLSVEGERLVIQGFSETVRNLEAEVWFDNKEVHLKRLACSAGKKGRVEASGTARVKHFQLADILLRAHLHNAPIALEDKAQGTITADFTVEGALGSLNIRGKAAVTEATFYADRIVEMSEEVVILETEVLGEKKVEASHEGAQRLVGGMSLEGRLEVPGNVWVKGRDINVELKGDLTFGKQPGKPLIINGELTTVRGFYEFKGKNFQIESGKAQFIGLPEADPILDIKGAYQVADVTIYLVVGGSLSKMTVSLNSNPSMDETDIMAYLLFGKAVRQLGRSESNRYQEAVLGFLGAGVVDKLKQVLGEKFSLDVLTYEGASPGFGASTLALGKYVTPRIFVTYKHLDGLESRNQVEAEYEINERLTIESTVGDNAASGADIFWRYEY